jgi:two-component system, OmpR family, response regulator
MYRVMLVEDDLRLAQLVTEYLNGYEFTVDLVTRGDQALESFKTLAPDVVVLDLMLPGLDGMVVCRQIRDHSEVPILILTAREDSYDEVSGLEQGALMRRAQGKTEPEGQAMVFGQLNIAVSDRSVTWRGQPCVLSNTEYKLLLVLAESAGRVLSRDALLKKMRGIEFDGLDRSIDNCISKLRRKFDDADSEKIKTVWGEGYLFSPSAWG